MKKQNMCFLQKKTKLFSDRKLLHWKYFKQEVM